MFLISDLKVLHCQVDDKQKKQNKTKQNNAIGLHLTPAELLIDILVQHWSFFGAPKNQLRAIKCQILSTGLKNMENMENMGNMGNMEGLKWWKCRKNNSRIANEADVAQQQQQQQQGWKWKLNFMGKIILF